MVCIVFEDRMRRDRLEYFRTVLGQPPHAAAMVKGSEKYPGITGMVRLYQTIYGVMVAAEISGLPDVTGKCASPVFAFHIHNGESCTGDESDPFADALTHYNPDECDHPHHAGDLPPLFSNNGYAFSLCLTNRFRIREVIGKTVIVHAGADDFTTQPAGAAGEKIACGVIRSFF